MAHPIAISIKNVYKNFGSKKVHTGIDFDVFKGELVGLLGGSGTGKSVLLRSIIRLEIPDAGQIFVDGKDISTFNSQELIQLRIQIGFVFQNGALFDSLTVAENLAYPLKEHSLLNTQEIQLKVEQMLKQVKLENAEHLFPEALSGGMQKRAGLARAIILAPHIILFDEPTAGLDPINTQNLLDHIQFIKSTGISGIFVTHDIPACFEICDRIAIINEGKIHVIADKKTIQRSSDPFIQQFIKNFHE